MRRMIAAMAAALLTCAVIVATAGAASRHAASKPATAAVSGLDKMSLQTSMQGDVFEIIGGKLALKKTHNPAVAKLARTLIKDHTKSYKDAVELAKEFGVPVEKTPSPTEVWQLLTVAKVRGATFDRWYTSLEVYDHVQDIQETTGEIRDGSNTEVVANAKQDLPVLKKHLKMAKDALKTVR
ncbi:MAG: DUF4142 domain-containing protein [Solirubrobacteraceae bacterium]